jgi:hypothetical protein
MALSDSETGLFEYVGISPSLLIPQKLYIHSSIIRVVTIDPLAAAVTTGSLSSHPNNKKNKPLPHKFRPNILELFTLTRLNEMRTQIMKYILSLPAF